MRVGVARGAKMREAGGGRGGAGDAWALLGGGGGGSWYGFVVDRGLTEGG